MINPGSVYRTVADALRSRIRAGEWAATGRLPSEADLAHEHEVGVDTIRRALGVLRSEGVIRSGGRGQRWVVVEPTEHEPLWMWPGTVVRARPATEAECVAMKLPEMTVLLEIHHRGALRLVRADRFELRFD